MILIERNSFRGRERQIEREKERGRERERGRQRETERQRQRQRETERDYCFRKSLYHKLAIVGSYNFSFYKSMGV